MSTLAFNSGEMIPVIAIVGGLAVAVVGIVFGTIKCMFETRARESTKREIAAYVAEGSMTPEDAERILKADMPYWERGRKA